jgi:hypothetical protein
MRMLPAGPELLDPYPFFAEMRRSHPVAPACRAGALEPAPGYFLHGVVRLPLQFRAG